MFQPEKSIKILVFLDGISFQSSYFVISDVTDVVVNSVAFVGVVVDNVDFVCVVANDFLFIGVVVDNDEVVVNVFVEVVVLVD